MTVDGGLSGNGKFSSAGNFDSVSENNIPSLKRLWPSSSWGDVIYPTSVGHHCIPWLALLFAWNPCPSSPSALCPGTHRILPAFIFVRAELRIFSSIDSITKSWKLPCFSVCVLYEGRGNDRRVVTKWRTSVAKLVK